MMTDIQGYSAAVAEASREEVISLIRRHNKLMRPVIEFYRGTIVKSIGDAFLCTFPSSTDAVICAIIIQLLLKEYNQRMVDKTHNLNLRIVINSGDVTLEQGDIFGTAVNVTSRMEGLDCFPGGSIGISESTHLLMDRTEIVAEKIGPKTLKGVPDPVVVYQVPLEKQKLNKLPVQLLTLVEKVINSKDLDSESSAANAKLNEWAQSVGSFLKQTNWGDNINKASKQIGNIQQSLAKTFGQKTVLEKKHQLNDASVAKRFKSGLIDIIILISISMAMRGLWWPTQRIVYGPTTISSYSEVKGDKSNWSTEYPDGKPIITRNPGLTEWLIDMNIHYPFLLYWFYFAIFWKFRQASPGQIACGNAVIEDDGNTKLSLVLVFKRSALYIISTLSIVGNLAVFFGEKRTLHDKMCATRVVE
jgi:class 3 adenylate cyclase